MPKESNRSLTCIVCPNGCHLTIDPLTLETSGNKCPRGALFAKGELTNPVRTLTSTVPITGSIHPMCPVKTSSPVPKAKIFEAMKSLCGVTINSPVTIGQRVCDAIKGSGISWIVCKDM